MSAVTLESHSLFSIIASEEQSTSLCDLVQHLHFNINKFLGCGQTNFCFMKPRIHNVNLLVLQGVFLFTIFSKYLSSLCLLLLDLIDTRFY